MVADRVLEDIDLDLDRSDDLAIPDGIVLRLLQPIAQLPHPVQLSA
jgi:hypothetical protein